VKLLLDQNLSRGLVHKLALLFGPPPHVVWLRVGNVSARLIEALLRRSVERLEEFAGSGEESLLVLSLAE